MLGVDPVLAAHDRVRRVRARRLLARGLRERSMSGHTRATIVVSHPPRFSTPPVPGRLRRGQDAWTASSASLGEPSIRWAPRPQVGPVGLESLRQPVVFVHRSRSLDALRDGGDERNPADVTLQ